MTEPDDAENVTMSPDDRIWMVDTLLALLQTPSPSGRTDAVMQLIGQTLTKLGVPFTLTRPLAYVVSNSPNLDLRSEGPSNQFVAWRSTI